MTRAMKDLTVRAVRNRTAIALVLVAAVYCAVAIPLMLLCPDILSATYTTLWSWITAQFAAHPILWPFLAGAATTPVVVATILRDER